MSPRVDSASAVSAGEYAASLSEKDLMQAIIDGARLLSYRVYHTYDARKSDPGFPDLVLLREQDGRRYVIECKSKRGTPTRAQLEWLEAFAACGIPALIARPDDLDTIIALLT